MMCVAQPDYDDGDYKSKPFFRTNSKDTDRKKYGKLNISVDY